VLLAAVAGCSPGGGSSGEPVGLAPSFPPGTPAAPSSTAVVEAAPAETVPGSAVGAPPDAGEAQVAPAGAGDAAPAPVLPTSASVADLAGDATPAVGAPAWADLVGGRLTRSADGFELRVALDGGSAPASSGADDRTMNVASFYDVDGDGSIDYEVWANLASGGWGGSWFDNRAGTARFADDSGVAIHVEGAEVVLRFPLSHLGGAERFRWSVASEWGPVSALGTELTARDDMPDDDAPAAFPG